jgi:hypothetical protein
MEKPPRVRKGLGLAVLALVAAMSLAPQHPAGAEKPGTKKPPVTTSTTTPEPYLEYKLTDILVSGV